MKNRTAVLVMLLVTGLFVSPVWAGDLPRAFYKTKRKTTTAEAYDRALSRLRSAQVGMSEMAFFETMELGVLARKGHALDVMLDGFLAEATRKSNEAGDRARQTLVFGFVKKGHEVARSRVILREHRVHEIRIESEAEPAVAAQAETRDAQSADAATADATSANPSDEQLAQAGAASK